MIANLDKSLVLTSRVSGKKNYCFNFKVLILSLILILIYIIVTGDCHCYSDKQNTWKYIYYVWISFIMGNKVDSMG